MNRWNAMRRVQFRDVSHEAASLMLLTLGATITAFSCKAMAIPQGVVFGGLSGAALLAHRLSEWATPGMWLLVLNAPLFVLGGALVGRRFFFVSLYGMLCLSLGMDAIDVRVTFPNPVAGAVATGMVMGFGTALVLLAHGSQGGLDIVARCLSQRLQASAGAVYLSFDVVLFSCAAMILGGATVATSLTVTVAMAATTDIVMRCAVWCRAHAARMSVSVPVGAGAHAVVPVPVHVRRKH